ncbi:MAG: aldehyde ferredoxin oxidoreductase N-terminal domain-containing protein, partial [Candidatus Bathyarchaeia archaeon]
MVGGYAGRYLDVDLAKESTTTFATDMRVAATLVGGLNYAIYLLWQRTRMGTEPLSPDNVLIFNTGPITGLVGTERGVVAFKSPLTGLIGHTEVGGHWCSQLKFAGYDGIVFTGKADRPVYLYVKDDEAEIRDATHVWGKTTSQTEQAIVREIGDPFVRVLCIGPAGENLCREACIIHTAWHAAARTGGGCVMGSKNLKAVAIRGTKGFPGMDDPERCFELMDGAIANA